MHHLYYPRCETLNCWRSFDTHFDSGAGSVLLLCLHIKEAIISVMTSCNQYPLWLPRVQDLKLLMLHWRSFSGWGRERLTTYFEHRGGRFIQREHWHTIVNIIQLTLSYLNATITRTTWNAKPDHAADRSSQPQRDPRMDGYGAGFGPPTSGRSGSSTVVETIRTVFPFQSRNAGGSPVPFANSTTRLPVNSPRESQKSCGQIDPQLNECHSDPMEIGISWWIPDITDWWRQQQETHSMYADLNSGARHILYHTTWYRSRGQWISWARCHQLEAVKNHMWDYSSEGRCKAVCWSQSLYIGRLSPSIGDNEHRKRLGNEVRTRWKKIAQNR